MLCAFQGSVDVVAECRQFGGVEQQEP